MHEESGAVLVSVEGPVGWIRLNRPDRLNVLDFALAEGLERSLAAFAADPAVRAVVLAGAGRSFMAGGDLAVFHQDPDHAADTASRLIDRFHAAIRTIRTMPKIVVAAVQGPVAGGGLGLALACDLCVAAETATFLSAYTRLGTSPDGGTTWSLARLLGPRRGLDLILLNDTLDAPAALGLGLVNRVVPPAELDRAAGDLARRLADGPALAQASAKRLVQAALASGFEAQLDLEKQAFVAAADSPDFREGISAFFERRTAAFGRG